MNRCGICGKIFKVITHSHLKMHSVTIEDYLTHFPQTITSWNLGLTKESDSRIRGGNRKGHMLGHPNYYSREYLGDRFDNIEKSRISKIGKTVVEKGIASKGGKAASKIRKQLPNYGFSEDSLIKLSKSMSKMRKGKHPWNYGLNKYNDLRVKKYGDAQRKYPDKIDFEIFGWTKDLRREIRNRDNWVCQMCGVPQGECKTVLPVHHINGDRRHNSKSNLVTLCRKCHRRVHFEQDLITGKFRRRKQLPEINTIFNIKGLRVGILAE